MNHPAVTHAPSVTARSLVVSVDSLPFKFRLIANTSKLWYMVLKFSSGVPDHGMLNRQAYAAVCDKCLLSTPQSVAWW